MIGLHPLQVRAEGQNHLWSAYYTSQLLGLSQTMDHLDRHQILTDCQHAFRANRSCESQLIITTHDLGTALSQQRQVDMAILDFSEAFDQVPHQCLIEKPITLWHLQPLKRMD